MGKAARAIILDGDRILVMHRDKYGSKYFTLVGGRVDATETLEQALVREIKEETGLTVVAARLVFVEEHTGLYNEQYIFLCEVAPHADIALQDASEEAMMNRFDANIHKPVWIGTKQFASLPFRTPNLQNAIINGLAKGFPHEPTKL
jgi:ADP-ribose pyrophosphatase YjhB (NUDIX family)